jgi:hypothetical protein
MRDAWERALREHGARLCFLVAELNGDSRERLQEHWKRLAPGLRGIEWRLPNWPNVFPVQVVREPDGGTLQELIQSQREHLRNFMDSWFSVRRDYAKWVNEYPEFARALNESRQYARVRFQVRPDGGIQVLNSIESPASNRNLYAAACTFADFLQNPLRDVLAGRCKRCRRYFFNRKGYEQMVYCTQKCRWDAHNAEKEQSREQAQQKMEAAALTAMRKLLSVLQENTRSDLLRNSWKRRIVEAVNKKNGTELESKWLTRAINNPDGRYHKRFIRMQDAIERLLPAAAMTSTTEEEP